MSTEANKAAVRGFFAAIDAAQSMAPLDGFVAPSYVASCSPNKPDGCSVAVRRATRSEPPTSETAVAVYPPGLSIWRFGKVAIPAEFVVAVFPVILKLPLLTATLIVISAPWIGFPFVETFRTVTTGRNCGMALRDEFRGGTSNATVEVNDTGPISLRPLTSPPPPPRRAGIMKLEASAGRGDSQSTT